MYGKQSKRTEIFSEYNKKRSDSSVSQQSDTWQSVESITGEKVTFSELPDDILGLISRFLDPRDEARLRGAINPVSPRLDRANLRAQGGSPALTTFFAPPQRTANYLVLTGRPEYLIRMLKKDPSLFFKKYEQSIDAAGQTFYNVSPADLISFICDADLQMQVNNFAQQLPPEQRETFFARWQAHHASRGRGGADLVRVGGAHPPQYESICNLTDAYYVFGAPQTPQRSLLKNPDGVIFWISPGDQLHWYYANHDTQTLEEIYIPHELPVAHQYEYEALVDRMKSMLLDTARRSSNQEHALIQQKFPLLVPASL